MKRIFVDSSFLIAYHHLGDSFHNQARCLMDDEMGKHIPTKFFITDYVFDEFVTLVMKRISKREAIQRGETLLSDQHFEVERINSGNFNRAWKVFHHYRDKMWSFTDCTSYVWIQQNKPDFCLATDSDFDEFGLVPNLVRR